MQCNRIPLTAASKKPQSRYAIQKHFKLESWKDLKHKTAIIGDTYNIDIYQANKISALALKVDSVDYKNIGFVNKFFKKIEDVQTRFFTNVVGCRDTNKYKDLKGNLWGKKDLTDIILNNKEIVIPATTKYGRVNLTNKDA